MVNEIKDGEGVEPGEEKVWSMVQVLKESRKGFSPTSGKVRTYVHANTHPTTVVLVDTPHYSGPGRHTLLQWSM